jgi:endonuclease/exonuclease/phosphatase family metal-dependent hydrolase
MHTAKLRVISFNLRYALRHSALAKTVFKEFAGLGPDVICLQEVLIGKKKNFIRDLAEALDLYESFFLQTGIGARQIGLATLAKSAPEESTIVTLPRSLTIRPRILSIARYNHREVPWNVANTHLSIGSYFNMASHLVRRAQLEAALSALEAVTPGEPLIFAGDFNTRTKKEVAWFADALRDAGFQTPDTLPYSWQMLGAKERLDWIATRNCDITEIGALPGVKGSDHMPIWADITYSKPHH